MTKAEIQKENAFIPETAQRTHDLGCLAASLHDEISRRMDEGHLIVRVAGFGSTGKSTIAKGVEGTFDYVPVLQTDGYMPDRETRNTHNWSNGDDPEVINFPKMLENIKRLFSGMEVPDITYDHATGKHIVVGILRPSKLIIAEGACALYDELLLPVPSLRIFLDADSEDTRAALRHQVNMSERGYSKEQSRLALPGYLNAYKKFVLPSMHNADHIVIVDAMRRYQTTLISRCACPPAT